MKTQHSLAGVEVLKPYIRPGQRVLFLPLLINTNYFEGRQCDVTQRTAGQTVRP